MSLTFLSAGLIEEFIALDSSVQTLFKIADPSLVQAASLTPSNATQKLNSLPLWVILQSLGIETIVKRILDTCELVSAMVVKISV